ncbi:DUF3068 domain-containing protein [Corynebacterium terpenotabidum]|uniref:DUF3068 domain-containing protein n=1 Tax=Corynebacterium terpenotabidum Y-11 TaxID=1200352 RepID=S4XBR0_9CORY|nr:DUF3068 domain-containing protein [Corynebacterium terpenotabidum]AGP29899.1 hypothetical protein A606_01220 [Corynebacterium terpenotabidum Y-11]
MKKVLSHALIVIGAALIVIAIALPTYVLPKGKVIPRDIESYTVTDETEGRLLDAGALAAGTPVGDNASRPECEGDSPTIDCFIWADVPLQNQRHILAQEPTTDKEITLEAGNTVFRTDLPEPENLIAATIDRVTLTRRTAFPVDRPVSSFDMTAPTVGGGVAEEDTPLFTRDGLQYQFPFGTEKKAYPYFDGQLLKSQDIDFVDKEKMQGETVYRFEQVIEPTELYPNVEARLNADGELSAADKASLSALRLTFPASFWGLTRDEVDGWEEDDETGPDVTMTRYYTVHRTLHVQPDTGVIIKGAEDVWMFYARDDAEAAELAQPENREQELADPQRTALYFPGVFNQATQDTQMNRAKEALRSMELIGTYIPWGAGILGILLLVIGAVLHRSVRRG